MFSFLRSAFLCSKVPWCHLQEDSLSQVPLSFISDLATWSSGAHAFPCAHPTCYLPGLIVPSCHMARVEVGGRHYPWGFQGWLTCPLLLFLGSPCSNKKPRNAEGRQKYDGAGIERGEWADSYPLAPPSWAPALRPREMESSSPKTKPGREISESPFTFICIEKLGKLLKSCPINSYFQWRRISDSLLCELKNHVPTSLSQKTLALIRPLFEPTWSSEVNLSQG